MSKLPIVKRILREDVKEAPGWIEKILYPINTFFEGVNNILNQSVDYDTNIRSQTRTIEFKTSSLYDGTPDEFETLKFPRTLKIKSTGLQLLQIIQQEDNFTPIETPVYVNWQEINGTMEIPLITGLLVSKTYTLKVRVT